MKLNPVLVVLLFLSFVLFEPLNPETRIETGRNENLKVTLSINQVDEGQKKLPDSQSAQLIRLKAEIIQRTGKKMSVIKSDSIELPNAVWATYNIKPEQSIDSYFYSFVIKFRPTLKLESNGKRMIDFDVLLYSGKQLIKEQTLTISGQDSLILELLEDTRSQTSILFKISPDSAEYPEILAHTLNIEAKIVPLFITNSLDDPIWGITKDDIRLEINGHDVPFQFFQYHEQEGADLKKDRFMTDRPAENVKASKRNVFIVLDYIFNTFRGIRLGKRFIRKLIMEAFPNDHIVLLAILPQGGLRHIIGPSDDFIEIVKKLEDLEANPDSHQDEIFSGALQKYNGMFPEFDDDPRHQYLSPGMGMGSYNLAIIRFTKLLNRLQYFLKAYKDRKVLFLISQGIAREGLRRSHYRNLVQEAIRGINSAETILYTVNPCVEEFKNPANFKLNGDESLRYMAAESGGKYFEGSDPRVVSNRIKRATTAYYEIVFTPTLEMGAIQNIHIRCRRKDAKLFYIQTTHQATPYKDMPELQKKLFILNVINGGTWSNRIANIKRIPYKIINRRPNRKVLVSVNIPIKLQHKMADIFVLCKDQDGVDDHFQTFKRRLQPMELIELEEMGGHLPYFVIVEPHSSTCLFNRIE